MPLWPSALHPVPARVSISSQVSQVPHGVCPPAQLVSVPDPLAAVAALAVGLDDRAAAAVLGARVVDRAGRVRHAELVVPRLDLVVLDQPQPIVPGREGRGAVVVAGCLAEPAGQAGLSGAGDDPVAEAGRQGQEPGRVVLQRRERAAGGGPVAVATRRAGPAGEGRQRAGDGEADAGRAAGEKLTSGDGHDAAPGVA